MTSAFSWADLGAIFTFHNCEGQSHKTASTDHNFWRERRAEADSNRGPSASLCLPALPTGQTSSHYPYRYMGHVSLFGLLGTNGDYILLFRRRHKWCCQRKCLTLNMVFNVHRNHQAYSGRGEGGGGGGEYGGGGEGESVIGDLVSYIKGRRVSRGLWGRDSSVVRAPDSWLKGRGFESLLERRENFLLQGRLSVLTLISVSVPPPLQLHVKNPGHSAKSAGGRLQLNTHTPYVCGFYWTVLRHWSQLVPNMSNDIWGH